MTDHTPRASGTGLTAAPTLTTGRTVLRGLRLSDFDDFAALWADAQVVRHITGTPATRAESWGRLQSLTGHWALIGYGYWAVTDRATGAFLGTTGLGDFLRGVEPPFDGTPEAGWMLAGTAQGKGLAAEAVAAMLGWADATLDAPRTVCIIAPGNAASLHLAGRLGFGAQQRGRYRGGETLILHRDRQTASLSRTSPSPAPAA